jgi:hypothetical protein
MDNRFVRLLALTIVAVLIITGCAGLSSGRTRLSYDDLMDGFYAESPIEEEALTLPEDAPPPAHIFEGRLELIGENTIGQITLIQGDFGSNSEAPHLPEFDFEFVQNDEGYLIPLQRGLIITDHPNWNYILEPGRVWSEPGDQGFSRVSFPFALVWKGSNAIFNGTMTFLFDDDGVSKVWYQITHETLLSIRADFWGLLGASYHRGPVGDADQIKAAFARELADRFPTKPIRKLSDEYPGIDVSAFGKGVNPEYLAWYGFVVDGINYVGGCQTRHGSYPYCEYMRAPSYSTAKSAFVSVALMRLAQKYGPDVPGLLVKDYVPEAADSIGDWSTVTFDHVLDMATGNYRSKEFMVDEEHWNTDPFWLEEYYTERIEAAFNWPNSGPPGTQWVYRTFDTFILTAALQNYLRIQEGPQADIFEFVVDEVYKPLKMGTGVYSTLRTRDNNWQGQPYGGYGLWWVPDDLAKITTLLNVDVGVIDGEQILDPGMLAASLQRNPDDRGVDINRVMKYNNAFWANHYTPADGFECDFWVAEMQGYTGIVVVLMPNGTSYYYASNNRDFTWAAAVEEADKIHPFCQ